MTFKNARKRAAQLCVAAPMLFGGQDLHVMAISAERMLLMAVRNRFEFATIALADCSLPEDTIIQVMSTDGTHGTDRMLAQWWWQVDAQQLVDLLQRGVNVIDMSVAELTDLHLFGQIPTGTSGCTYDLFYPSEVDGFLMNRRLARQELTALLDKLRKQAERAES